MGLFFVFFLLLLPLFASHNIFVWYVSFHGRRHSMLWCNFTTGPVLYIAAYCVPFGDTALVTAVAHLLLLLLHLVTVNIAPLVWYCLCIFMLWIHLLSDYPVAAECYVSAVVQTSRFLHCCSGNSVFSGQQALLWYLCLKVCWAASIQSLCCPNLQGKC